MNVRVLITLPSSKNSNIVADKKWVKNIVNKIFFSSWLYITSLRIFFLSEIKMSIVFILIDQLNS